MLFKKKKVKGGKSGKSQPSGEEPAKPKLQPRPARPAEGPAEPKGEGQDIPLDEKLKSWEDKLRKKAQDLKMVKTTLDKKMEELETRTKALEEKEARLGSAQPEEEGRVIYHRLPKRASLEEWMSYKEEADALVRHIEQRLEDAKDRDEKLLNYQTKLEEYKDMGYAVERFDNMEEMASDDLEKLFAEFEEAIELLRSFEEKLDQMNEHFPEIVEGLRELLKDVDAVPQLEKAIREMEAKMGEEKNKYLAKLAEYKADGLDVTVLEEALEHDIQTISKEFSIYEEQVGRMKVIKQKLDSLDPLFEKDIEELREQMKFPELLPDIEEKVDALEDKEEDKKREFLDKLRSWQEAGFNVSRLENISSGSLAFIDEEFSNYEVDVNGLKKQKERLGALDVKGKGELEVMLMDPDKLEAVTKRIDELETEAKDTTKEGPKEEEDEERKKEEDRRKHREELEERRKKIIEERIRKREEDRKRKEEGKEEPKEEGEEEPKEEGAAGDDLEAQVKQQMEETEKIIEEAKAKGKDVNSPNNLLRLARSFMRSKNFDKALQYSKRSHKMVTQLINK